MPCYAIDAVVPVVAPGAFVHPDAVLIGDVQIAPDCYIGPTASLRGDFGRILVGTGSNVQDGCVLHAFPGQDMTLHPGSHVGHGAILHGCTVHAGALIGMNSVVLDGAVIESGALVAAGTVVPAGLVVPAGHLVAGVPGRVVRELDEESRAWQANGVRTYQELAVRSLAGMQRVTPLEAPEVDRPRIQATGSAANSLPLHQRRERNRP